MSFEAVLLAYCVVVLLSRFLGGRSSTAPWELVLSVAVGVAWALQPVQRSEKGPELTSGALVAIPLGLAIVFAAREPCMWLCSAALATHGLLGLVRGRITLRGRVGPGREYTGAAAYIQSAFCILLGACFIAISLFSPGFWPR